MPTDRFIADKDIIRAELERRARARQTVTYGEAAALVKRTARGLGKILNAIKVEEAGRSRPEPARSQLPRGSGSHGPSELREGRPKRA